MFKRMIPVFIIILVASVSFAQMHHGKHKDGKKLGKASIECPMKGGMEGPHGCMGIMKLGDDKFLKKLGVSDSNRATIRETIHKMDKDVSDVHFQIREAHIKLREEYSKQSLDDKVIGDLNEKVADLHRQKALLMLNTTKIIMALLTPEQRDTLSKHHNGKMEEKCQLHKGSKK